MDLSLTIFALSLAPGQASVAPMFSSLVALYKSLKPLLVLRRQNDVELASCATDNFACIQYRVGHEEASMAKELASLKEAGEFDMLFFEPGHHTKLLANLVTDGKEPAFN